MQPSLLTVLVAGGASPDRTILLERLLREAAARSGWGERLSIRCGGLGPAAGRLSDAGAVALRSHGVDTVGAACPDLKRRPDLFDGCDVIVCDSAEVADALVDWDQTAGARFLCLDDVAASREEVHIDPEAPIAEDAARIERLVPEVLRRLVAGSAAD